MDIETFQLERLQSLWENEVEINLTESGIHPYTLRELLTPAEITDLLDVRLGYGWTNGSPELRQAICRYYPGAGPENILVTNGSAESNFLAAWSLLSPGDEVVLMLPNYMQIWGIARALGAVVKPFHLQEEHGWAPDMDELRDLVHPDTRMIVLCNPNNPTGAVLASEVMEEIVELAAANQATLYVDEVYRGVELDGEERPSFRDFEPTAIIASGLSKALAHPGLRVGWLVAPERTIAEAWRRNDYTTITSSVLSQHIATHILEPNRRHEILERNRAMLRQNLQVLERWIASREDIHLTPPAAGGMAFIRYQHPLDSMDLYRRLRDELSLLVLPGAVYGLEGYLRLGIGERAEVLEEGLRRLGEGLDQWR